MKINHADNNLVTAPSYNNCFVVGGKCLNDEGELIKTPVIIEKNGFAAKLFGGKDGPLRRSYELTYEQTCRAIERHLKSHEGREHSDTLRVSLYLDNAKYGDLHIFVIDVDAFDESSEFFQRAKELADKVSRSQGGGYHFFTGLTKKPPLSSLTVSTFWRAMTQKALSGQRGM